VRVWDSSAVVPLLVEQERSQRVATWVAEDQIMVLWTLTPAEIVSALRRLVREHSVEEAVARVVEVRLDELVHACHVIVDVDPVKSRATRLLRLHPLRAFDALQLGAALHWAEGYPEGRTLHTFDSRLAAAAQREGFVVPV
jgi:predicted nucleic acid-binding protein